MNESSSTRCYIENIAMRSELEMLRIELAAEKKRNAHLTQENENLVKELTESKNIVSAQKVENEQLFASFEKEMQENKSIIAQLQHDKKDLIKNLQTAHQIITDLKHVESTLAHVGDITMAEENLKKEQLAVEELRKATHTVMRQQLEKETNKNGELFAWQSCEICLEPFSHQEKCTPRILGCGHTFCLGCTKRLSEHNTVKCPFDRLMTQFDGKIEESLSKNYSVLNMCT